MGKREGLVYLVVTLWVILGALGVFKGVSLSELSVYFGSLTAYVGLYVWSETKKPSLKTSVFKKGPTSRREAMIYIVTVLWALAGAFAMWYKQNLNEVTIYFVSLTGFVTSWILGEVYKPEDDIKKNMSDK
jgi:hypothetical protein